MMTGRCAVAGFDLMRWQTSKQSMPGIITSSRMMSGRSSSTLRNASGPEPAVTTSKYSAPSFASSSLTLAGISSTTRTRAVMASSRQEAANGLEKIHDRDRLGDISLAAAFADLFLIALHRERGDGDDRNGFETVVFLQPLGDFQTGDFRQLDIHQNKVRTM